MSLDRFQNAESPIDEYVYVECDNCMKEILKDNDEAQCAYCGHEGCVHCIPVDKDTLEHFCGVECKENWQGQNSNNLLIRAKIAIQDRINICSMHNCTSMSPCEICKDHARLIIEIEKQIEE